MSFATAEDKRVRRKVDVRIMPYIAFIYLLAFLDRVNIGNVHSMLKEELGLTENQYAFCVGIFFAGYVLFELPSNLLMKKATPPVWIARILFSWGLISTLTAFADSFEALAACRFFLGMAEAGFFPGIVYYLTFWYPREERALRIGFFYSTAALAGAFGGLLAYAILSTMEGVGGLFAFQWLFIIEGVPSILFSVVTWYYLPDFPSNARFLSDTERQRVMERVARSEKHRLVAHPAGQSSQGSLERMEVSIRDDKKEDEEQEEYVDVTRLSVRMDQPISRTSCLCLQDVVHWDTLKQTLRSPMVWFFALLYLTLVIPFYSAAFFLPVLIQGLGLSLIDANLMTVPIYVAALVVTLVVSYYSDRYRMRAGFLMISSLLSAAGFLGLSLNGNVQPENTKTPFTTHAVVYGYLSASVAVICIYPTIACSLSWLTETVSDRLQITVAILDEQEAENSRMTAIASATAIVVSFGNIGGYLSPLFYSSSFTNAGSYVHAHIGNVVFLLSAFLLTAIGRWLYPIHS